MSVTLVPVVVVSVSSASSRARNTGLPQLRGAGSRALEGSSTARHVDMDTLLTTEQPMDAEAVPMHCPTLLGTDDEGGFSVSIRLFLRSSITCWLL